jgi:hypothetical protein
MSNNKSLSSKVASFRIPVPEYMEILEKASENHMTITDLLLQIVFKYLNGNLVELNEGDKVYSKKTIEGLQICSDLQNEEEARLKTENKRLTEKIEILEKENIDLNNLLKGLRIVLKYKKPEQKC